MTSTALTDDQLIVMQLRKRYSGQTETQVRKDLKEKYTQTWNDEELLQEFEVQEFDGPIVCVIRKIDGIRGTVGYIDEPRVYFAFVKDGDEL